VDETQALRTQIADQEDEIARLERMLEVSRLLNSTLNLEELLIRVQRISRQLTATDASSILLLPRKPDELHFQTATGVAKDKLPRIVVPIEGSIAGEVVKTGAPLVVQDARHDPRFYEGVDDATSFSTRSILAVPLIVKDKTIGVIEVLNKTEGQFTDEDVEVLTTMAAHAAVAIENARLFQQSDLISEVVHELRTPLSSIVGYSKMLTMPSIADEMKSDFASVINREATRLGQLVNDFLDWSRLESGRVRLAQEPVDLRQTIDEALRVVEPEARERDITIDLQISPDLPAITGDPARLKQVLINLASNATKYNREGGQIGIRAAAQDSTVSVSVSDTGFGIATQDLPHIFERFFRVAVSEKQAKGTGLGLSIAKQIVELHGGEMTVASEVNVGSTFSFTLPVERPAASDLVA
jgi:signal transduction histidine kinase